jgi:hypothetical protein
MPKLIKGSVFFFIGRVNMSGTSLRVYQDFLLAIMGHILINQYREEALDALIS